MEEISLKVIAKACGSDSMLEGFTSCICHDTRKITEGSLFIAIKGDNFDGHDFAKSAIEKGAIAVISEKNMDDVPCIKVKNTRQALLDIASYYRSRFKIKLVGVTGSVGKTTTKEMISLVMSSQYNTLKTKGNFNNEIGLPMTLFELSSEHQAAVIEMGMSEFKEIARLSKCAKPDIGVITNIGVSHIENLGSKDGILKAKLEILEGMSEKSPLVLNFDDEYLVKCIGTLNRKIIGYGIENKNADVRAENILGNEYSTIFDIVYNGNSYKAEIPCIGRHNVLNALAAFTVGMLCEIPVEKILQSYKGIKPEGFRQNIVRKGEQVVIMDCYNASPDSMKAALSVLTELNPVGEGRRVAVLADMLELGEKSEEFHRQVGEMAVNASVDVLACYGNDAKFMAQRADELGLHAGYSSEKDMLIKYLKMKLKPNDIVLFKGSRGMKLEEVIDELYKQN